MFELAEQEKRRADPGRGGRRAQRAAEEIDQLEIRT
jgi:hypothetical protein